MSLDPPSVIPPALEDPQKAHAVREMFGRIAHRYDLLNHCLSGNIDRRWRRLLREAVAERLGGRLPGRVLDVGCGTGDLSIEFAAIAPVIGCDFSHPMLAIGAGKVSAGPGRHAIGLVEADALRLPFADGCFDAIVSAFVLRNLADLRSGIREMGRVARPGSVLGILEFAMPKTPVLGPVYEFYFTRVLPRIGSLISGVEGPYRYLPESVRAFPPPERLCDLVESCGFRQPRFRLLTGGIAAVVTAES
jgi:demethylmenaquinone methyltransferase/2-methoxy-6-polyprenyl-1,4-benzoquinol methylase